MDIKTFDNVTGAAIFFRAAGHPLAAEKFPALLQQLQKFKSIAVFDPEGHSRDLAALYDLSSLKIAAVFVHRFEDQNQNRLGHQTRLLCDLPATNCDAVFVIDFDHGKRQAQLAPILPSVPLISLSAMRLPDELLTVKYNYLDRLNFAGDFILFRNQDQWQSRVATANYWLGHGGSGIKLWLRLFDGDGTVLATVTRPLPDHGGSVIIDSLEFTRDFPELKNKGFCGSLFIHAIGAKGHDVIKYALDSYADRAELMSCTHDSNPFPADYYAGLPAPADGEVVRLWLQNCHPTAIPGGTISLNRMGLDSESQSIPQAIPPFGTVAVDLVSLFPKAKWPEQYELQAKKYFGRPRYEITTRAKHQYLAHINVERSDLAPDAELAKISPNGAQQSAFGKGYLLPAPILPMGDFTSVILPTPMSRSTQSLPLAIAIYSPDGKELLREKIGNLPRNHATTIDASGLLRRAGLKAIDYGHSELFYDLSAGGAVDGWLHALFRFERQGAVGNGQKADTSFGAHIYNTPFTYKKEPQSYLGQPPGLSTRLFLRVDGRVDGSDSRPINDTICHLIYPSSAGIWHKQSTTHLLLCNAAGETVAERTIHIAQSGSYFFAVQQLFTAAEMTAALAPVATAPGCRQPAVLVRDTTCRLFGFHGLVNPAGGFAFDHMFGF
ncbi:MAG: hypothetical protein QM523_10995 [Candidatus Pacebacteria bacterium]|nr:hypothetical protein [Candidatus Paceibacterota bacterium]